MKRFIDLRFQGTQNRFAFWDTVLDRFMTFNNCQAWATLSDFCEDFLAEAAAHDAETDEPETDNTELERYCQLCPEWLAYPPTEEELDFREEATR